MIVIIVCIIVSIITGTIETVFHNTNEFISSISDYVQAICVVLQSILIYKQFKLSQEIEEKSRAENKGIFILENNDKRYYNLKEGISFKNIGNDHVVVKGTKKNNNDFEGSEGTFFTNLDEFSKLTIDLKLSEEELKEEIIEIVIELKLENLKSYQYIEIIEMTFRKVNNEIYDLERFNIKLK